MCKNSNSIANHQLTIGHSLVAALPEDAQPAQLNQGFDSVPRNYVHENSRDLTSSLTRPHVRCIELQVPSLALNRIVRITVLLPPYYRLALMMRYPLVILNDGQDFPELRLEERLNKAYAKTKLSYRIVVGIHANERRMREYGTTLVYDHAGRGDLTAEYSRFVTTELLPFLKQNFRVGRRRQDIAMGGFSMGGLSAFDIAWRHSHTFGAVGCFSASFWWKSAPFRREAPDADRIIVDRVWSAEQAPKLIYYFMAGDREEEDDRNGNGIIDVIDDTQAVADGLRAKGVPELDLAFRLVADGRHDQRTWGPAVLKWLRWLDER